MIRMILVAAAILATIAIASPAVAQTGAPVRTPLPPHSVAGSTVLIAERRAPPCADRSCAAKPFSRGYVGAAPLGW
jgi:hypothetical protein